MRTIQTFISLTTFRLLALGITVLAGLLVSPTRAETPFSRIVVFGDSLADTGNAFLGTGGLVAGEPYYQGRFSNGRVWVERLADELGLASPVASLLGGFNYAWAGAETGPGLSSFDTPNIGLQLDSYLADHGGFAGDELIVIVAGSNDLGWQPPYGPGHIVENLREHIIELAAAGGTTFLVANSPVRSSLGSRFNDLLAAELKRLGEKLTISLIAFDYAGVQAEILTHPDDFGLTNTTDPACPGCGIGIPALDASDTMVPNPDEYYFWDLLHPTRVVHAITGQAAAALVELTLQP